MLKLTAKLMLEKYLFLAFKPVMWTLGKILYLQIDFPVFHASTLICFLINEEAKAKEETEPELS